MTTVAIPEWNTLGLLPPINPTQPAGAERSPYPVALLDVAMRFATSSERRRVLSGFLDYRAALHNMGWPRAFNGWMAASWNKWNCWSAAPRGTSTW